MKKNLEDYILVNLSNPIKNEIDEIVDIFHIRKYSEKDFFKRNDQISKKLAFICQGSFKHCGIKKNGTEVTGKITKKDNFLIDFLSYRSNKLTPIRIVALEPSIVLEADVIEVRKLLETNLTFNRILREYTAENAMRMGMLHLLFLTGTAKERYEFLIENNPTFLKSMPLKIIASMIGVTATQLSRIRKKIKGKGIS